MTSLANRLRRRHSPPAEKPLRDKLLVDDGRVQHARILIGDVRDLGKAPSSRIPRKLRFQLLLNRDPHRKRPAGKKRKADHSPGADADLDVPPCWRLNDGEDRERQSDVNDDPAAERVDFSCIYRDSASARRNSLAATRSSFRSSPLGSRAMFVSSACNNGQGSAHVLIAVPNASTSARTITDARSRSSDPAYRRSVSYSGFSASRAHLRDLDVLASRALRTLSSLKCDGLAFAKIVETSFTARGAVEEVFVSVTCQDETEPLVTDEPLDRSVHGRHVDLLDIHVMANAL